MAKKHKKREVRRKRQPRQLISPPPRQINILRRIASHLSPTGWFWASVSLAATFVGLYFLLRTQITIEPDVSLDPSDANATLFRFTNHGVLPIYDISRNLTVNSLGDPAKNNWLNKSYIENTPPNVRKLSAGEATTVSMPTIGIPIPVAKYTVGDISLVFSFKDCFGLKHMKQERFQCALGVDGVVHWFHKSVSE